MQPREPLLSHSTDFNEQLVLLEHVNDAAVFYSGKQHGKHLDLLLHLSRYSNLLLTVTGLEGSGKTHLKKRMLKQLDSGVVVSHLAAENPISAAQLLHLLSQNLNIEIPPKADFDFYITEIRNFSSLLNEEGGSCLIVIDNAELLEQDALNIILELATTTSDSHRPHIALFGSPKLFSKLNQKENITRFESVGHHLPLEAFNETETRAYLAHRCASVGIDQLPLNDSQLLKVYRTAKGLPGLLNKALVDELKQTPNQPTLDTKSKNKPPKNKLPAKVPVKKPKAQKPKAQKTNNAKKSKTPVWPIFGAATLAALLVVGYIYKDQLLSSPSLDTSLISRSHEIGQEKLPWQPPAFNDKNQPLTPKAEPEDSTAASQFNKTEADELVLEEIEQPVADTLVVEPEQAKIKPQPESKSATDTSLDLPDDTPNVATTPKEVIEPTKKQPVPSPKVTAKPPTKKATWADQGARREATLMAKPKEHFTLQMMGSLDESSVKNFIQAQTINPSSFSYFEGRYKGQPWYVVVYGDYSDRDKALEAVQNLPESLRKQRPWARNFLSVQNDILSR